MSDLLAQHEACLARLFDAPEDAEVRDDMLVIGDALEAAGHPLGRRVALSESIHKASSRSVRATQERELAAAAAEQRVELFAHAAPLADSRSLRIFWRGGWPYAAALDTRYLRSKPDPLEAASYLLNAPVFSKLRRLAVRAKGGKVAEVGEAILGVNLAVDLEELIVGERPHPSLIGRRTRGAPINARDQELETLYPRLWLMAYDNRVSPLFDSDAAARPLIETPNGEYSAPARLVGMGTPLSVADYAQIGRCLWSPEVRLRVSALRVIARHGISGRFASSIRLILRPGLCTNQDDMIRELLETGQHRLCNPVLKVLARISGSANHYDAATRRAAGQVLAKFRKEKNA